MAGTLTISTLSDGTNSTSSTNCIQGSAKAWVNYNANAQTISASYNVSSITYSSTQYKVNFTNAMVDANYVTVSTCGNLYGGSTQQQYTLIQDGTFVPTASAVQIAVSGSNNPNRVCIAIFR